MAKLHRFHLEVLDPINVYLWRLVASSDDLIALWEKGRALGLEDLRIRDVEFRVTVRVSEHKRVSTLKTWHRNHGYTHATQQAS